MCGGAYNGIYTIGALNHLVKQHIFDIEDIENIYGTSAGALIGAILCLRVDWDTIINYIVERPWERDLIFTPDMMFNMIPSKGILDSSYIRIFFENLLKAKNLSSNITLSEFYDFSKIHLFLFAVEVNTFDVVKISHKSHPDLKLIDAIFITCSIPFLFQPTYLNNTYLVDGGVICNYPLDYCIEDGAKEDEILGIQFHLNKDTTRYIDPSTNILYYGYYMFDKLIGVARKSPTKTIPNQVIIPCDSLNIPTAVKILNNKEFRIQYIKKGEECAELFLSYNKSKEQYSKN